MAELVSNSTIFLNTDSVEEREKSLKKKRILFALKCNKYTHKNLQYWSLSLWFTKKKIIDAFMILFKG